MRGTRAIALPSSTTTESLYPLYFTSVHGLRLPLAKSLLVMTCLPAATVVVGVSVSVVADEEVVGVEEGASDVVDDELGASGDSPGSGLSVR